MFSFMKKDKEKEKEKREKHERKKKDKEEKKEREKKERQSMTAEEMSRLEEMRRGLLRRFSDKEKKRLSHKSADHSNSSDSENVGHRNSASSVVDRNSASSIPSKEAETLIKPHLPTQEKPSTTSSTVKKEPPSNTGQKPAVKSILKRKAVAAQHYPTPVNLDDSKLLQDNTKYNEDLFIQQTSERVQAPSPEIVKASMTTSTAAALSPTFNEESIHLEDTDSKPSPYESKLKLPVIVPAKLPRMREIQLQRMKSGGFGFSLRKGMVPERGGSSVQVVTFAEPGGGNHTRQTGLIPGDKLIEVNGQNVENIPREEIAEIIKQAPENLTLKVQPIIELIELSVRPNRDGTSSDIPEDTAKSGTLKRTGSQRSTQRAHSEEEVKSAKEWLETEKVWLVHRGGFSEVYQLQTEGTPLPEGRVRVKLDSGDVIEVDEDDIEKANLPQFDKAEDLAMLRYLNESSVLHTLRQRYASNLIHTYAGPSLIIINPMQQLPIYAEKITQMLKGCKQEDMPPHIFSMAQIVYKDMLTSRKDQSLLLLGKSGSGKTVNVQHFLRYLIMAAGSVSGVLTVEKLNSIYTLLHAFGCSRTSVNTNASRFTQIFTVDFDHTGQIASASMQALMFEKTRVVRRPEGESTFNVFYQFLAGADDSLRTDLQMQALIESGLLTTLFQKPEEKQKTAEEWLKLLQAFNSLNFSKDEVKAITCVLAAICHLCSSGTVKGNGGKVQFAKHAVAQKAAALLGTTAEELGKAVFFFGGTSTLTRTASLRVGSATNKPTYFPSEASATAQDCLDAFIVGLYADVFSAVVYLINRSMSSNVRAMTSITLVDCPGFQSSGAGLNSGRNSGATFEDLCHNYTQERLQAFHHELALSSLQDLYDEENIILDFDTVSSNPYAVISLLDSPPQQGLIKSPTSEPKKEKKGLLWILEEEAMFPGATEDSFMERLFQQHCTQPVRKESLLRKGSLGYTFVLNHNLGTTPVLYNAQGWLKFCRENPISRNATLVLQDSKKASIAQLFSSIKGPIPGDVGGLSGACSEGTSNLRKASSMRRTFNPGQAVGLKKKSVCLQVKFSVDTILDILKKTNVHFVLCVLPHHFAGLEEQPKSTQDDCILNVPLVRNQLRGFEVLDALRLYRQGFPDHMPFSDFINKFLYLLPGHRKGSFGEGDEKVTVGMILDNLDVDKLSYRVGNSRVFFRPGCLGQLDVNREEKFTKVVERFQAMCRGYLGRKRFEKLKVQHMAIKCLQKNVRRYFQIRGWEWWRLYTKVKPLLNVQRTEEELKERQTQIEALKAKNEKLEKERTEYKIQCDKLENRLNEVSADLAAENSASSEATELLEAEMSERLKLDKDLRDMQNKFSSLKRHNEKIEMELVQARLWQAESSVVDDLEEKEDISEYKSKYERLFKELQVTKKQLQQQHQDEMEQELQSRKQIERRLHEAVAEAEEQRRLVQVAKKRAQRLTAEMQDMKLHLEEQMSRNNELERKQRRFDSELSMAHEDISEEKAMREKLQRERDELLIQKYALEQTVQQTTAEQQSLLEKCERLEKEINDLLMTGKDNNNESVALKRSKHELEMKIQEQEEELDDQAGQIQQLEQAKLRLEMNFEKSRQQHQKELEEKDQDIEEIRYKTQKKLRLLESQLEEEYEHKKRVQEEKAQLERKLQAAGSKEQNRDREVEKRLRCNLRKTKALLNDAGAALLKQKDIEAARAQISALRNQLEDAEFMSSTAVKAKKRVELDMQELQQQLDDMTRAKQEAEAKTMLVLREKSDAQTRLEEVEEDLNEVMKKYKASVQQQSVDQIALTDQMSQIEELSHERDKLKQEVTDLESKVQAFDSTMVDRHKVERLETKIRDLDSRLELEVTTKRRLESQVSRLKEQLERVTVEKEDLNLSKLSVEEANKRVQKQLKDLREEFGEMQKRELEASQRKKELESRVDELEADNQQCHSDLKLALKRITDLQAALENDLDSDSDALSSDSECGDGSSDESDLSEYLVNHKGGGGSGTSRPLSSAVSSLKPRLSKTSKA